MVLKDTCYQLDAVDMPAPEHRGVLIEDLTGVRCVACPNAAKAAKETKSKKRKEKKNMLFKKTKTKKREEKNRNDLCHKPNAEKN